MPFEQTPKLWTFYPDDSGGVLYRSHYPLQGLDALIFHAAKDPCIRIQSNASNEEARKRARLTKAKKKQLEGLGAESPLVLRTFTDPLSLKNKITLSSPRARNLPLVLCDFSFGVFEEVRKGKGREHFYNSLRNEVLASAEVACE